jgi:AcrR family transcriptional regulator
MASSKREQLIDSALGLFCRDGFHATGIDAILAQAGVAKMTLYKHFRSKDELILATLRRRDEHFRNGFMRAVEGRAGDPRRRLAAMFDVLGEWFAENDFTGCMLINAAAEFARPEDPVHAVAAESKRLLQAYVRDTAAAAGAAQPDALAWRLMLLIQGAIVMAQVTGAGAEAAAQGRGAAQSLVDAALA